MYDSSNLSELVDSHEFDAGSTVMDVWPGNGDWTRLFSDIVGPEGRVYSFVPAELAHFKSDPVGQHADAGEGAGAGERGGRLGRPRGAAGELAIPGCRVAAPVLPRSPYRPCPGRGATAAAFNRAVYERLKPGGFYVIVDHVAAAGTGTSHAESLHRIEPAAVREEVEAAGFVLDAESTVLANKADPHSAKVFDPSIKGETDRFAYRFVRT